MRRLVLVGAGHAHLEVLRRLAAAPPPGTAITLVSAGAAATYSGMLPGVVAGHYAPDALRIPVAPLAEAAGARLVLARATGLDPAARRLRLEDGAALAYDLLSLDIGSTPDLAGAPPLGDRLLAVKPLERFLPALAGAEATRLAGPDARLAVVGGGPAGVEMALALRHRFLRAGRDIACTLVERGPRIVPDLPAAARRHLEAACARHGVAVMTGTTLDAALAARFDLVLWATGAAAPPWPAAAGLACDPRGFVRVGPTLASLSHPEIFAAGDIAAMAESPRPKAGVFAVRQGPILAGNLVRRLDGRPLRRYRPQSAWLSLLATGPRHAVAARNGLALAGRWVWWWKDWNDRRFVARYRRPGEPPDAAAARLRRDP